MQIAYFLQEHVATKLAKYEIAEDDMLLGERLGAGGYGAVYKGFWLSKGTEVAAKKCTGIYNVDMTDANIMRQLGEHPHIVSFCGYIYRSFDTMIIMQLVKNGSLYDHLHKKGNKPSLQQSLTWAKQISYAMSFLHSKEIAHLDLKSSNVLLSDGMEALICDFGTSRKLEKTTNLSEEAGTRRWMAPEIARGALLNRACDVYSFAMVLWELVEHRIPFFEEKEEMQVSIKAMNGERPSIGKTWPEYLADLVQVCWDDNPQKRPTFMDITQSLNSKQVIISPPELQKTV